VTDQGGEPDRVLLLDPSKPWSPGMSAPSFAIPGDHLVAILDDGAGHLVLAGHGRVRVLDSAQARAGREATTMPDLVPDAPVAAASLAAGRLFLSLNDATRGPVKLLVIDLAQGKALTEQTLGYLSFADTVLAAPGGRFLWWLERGTQGRRLESAALDPATGAPGLTGIPVELPVDASPLVTYPLYAYPTGANVVVTDEQSDQLLLLE
jgi:hypothetical protein